MSNQGPFRKRAHITLCIVFLCMASCARPISSPLFRSNPSPITDAALATDFSHLPKTGELVHDTPNGKLWSMPLIPQAESISLFRVPAGTFAFQPIWSTAAQQIAYGYIRPDPKTGRISSARLWIANLDGTDARAITAADSTFAGTYRDPAWSPDGRSLWATVQFPQQDERGVTRFRSEIRRIDLATGAETTILSTGRGPALASDNQHLAYLALETQAEDATAERNAIWLATLDGKNARVLVPAERFEEIYVPMRFSPDGKFLAFAAADAVNQLQRTPPAANSLWMIEQLRTLAGWFGPTPVYAHGLYPADVWLVEIETGKLDRLTQLSEDHPTPVWSLDGKYLAFAGVLGVYVIDIAERRAVRITDQGMDGQIEWVDK